MDKISFDSTSTIKGFLFQFLVALEKCFEMQEGQSVYIERYGDVSIVGEEESEQIESKYYTKDLTDLDENVWNTLANWMDSSFPLEKFSALVLLTTQKTGAKSQWRNWNSKNNLERKAVIDNIYNKFNKQKKKSAEIQKLMKKVFDSGKAARLKEIISKLTIDSLTMEDQAYFDKLKDTYGHNIPKIQRSKYIHGLYGFVLDPKIVNSNWEISYEDFNREDIELTKTLQDNTVIFPAKKNLGDINESEYLSNHFVSKIQDIEYGDVISDAVSDYVHTGRLIMDDIEISPTIKASYDAYEKDLEYIYNSKYRKACRNCAKNEVIHKSQDLYDDITGSNEGTFHTYLSVPLYFHNGVMHILANEKPEIVWKLKTNDNE